MAHNSTTPNIATKQSNKSTITTISSSGPGQQVQGTTTMGKEDKNYFGQGSLHLFVSAVHQLPSNFTNVPNQHF